MKKLALLCICLIILTSYGANPPLGKTAAPGEGFCAECHRPSSTPFNGSIDVIGIPDTFQAFTTYPLTITIYNPDLSITRGGFEMTILDAVDNDKVGNLTNKGSNTTIRNSGGRQYLSHGPAHFFNDSTSVQYTTDWESGDLSTIDSIKIYAASVLANGNASNSGDTPIIYQSSNLVTEIKTHTNNQTVEERDSYYSNKTIYTKNNFNNSPYQIYDFYGNLIQKGNTSNEIDVTHLNPGVYIYMANKKPLKFVKY